MTAKGSNQKERDKVDKMTKKEFLMEVVYSEMLAINDGNVYSTRISEIAERVVDGVLQEFNLTYEGEGELIDP